MPPAPRGTLHSFLNSSLLMGCPKHLLRRCPAGSSAPLLPWKHQHRLLHTHLRFLSPSSLNPPPARVPSGAPSSTLRSCRMLTLSPVAVSKTVQLDTSDENKAKAARLEILKSKLKEKGIPCDPGTPGRFTRHLCPKASEEGNARSRRSGKLANYRVITEEDIQLEPLCNEIIQWFFERMITAETLRRNGIMQRKLNNEIFVAFPYKRNGKLISCKYRSSEKKFFQEKDTEKIFYGLDDLKQATDIIIVEGEMDKLAMEEAGFRSCVSVPDGAPAQVSKNLPEKEEDKKYQYLWNCKEYLDKASRIILATDADNPGQALAEELARRIGKERCWRVTWPMKNDVEVCKDANEVLMYLGPDALKRAIEDAEPFPIKGLFRFSNYFHEIDAYYHLNHGYELGVATGWRGVDELYKVVPGELTIVSGVPNSGKSEWIDALLCNINATAGWTFALCSMENKVREHARKLLEKHIKKPFFDARYGGSTNRMSVEELEQGKEWLNDTFHLIRCEDDCLPSISWVLNLAKAAVLRYGVQGLVIDPYNELDHQRPPNQTETEYVSQMLTKIKRFAQHHSCHVWFVAHPRQLQNWNGGPPNLYDISGSAHFVNKCDNGIIIHRNRDRNIRPLDLVQVCVRKGNRSVQ
uniref:DNA primase/helicase n=1 Tax=Anthurium amnicola TaxID=1678845 RepID=A0A1D1YS60_9ARAE